MARKPRIHYPGATYHVVMRGNARQDIFFDDQDRFRFYLLLQYGAERFGHRIHAFCLMTNHVHLAIQVGDIPLSRIMQNLAMRYTRWVNRKHNRTGHLFQGRYKAILVETESYLLELTRYLHLNPVRAGMVSGPEEYPWSGHRAYLGVEILPWLSSDWVLGQFTHSLFSARENYRHFVDSARCEGHRPDFHAAPGLDGRVLGDDGFTERVLAEAGQKSLKPIGIELIVERVTQEYGVSLEDLAAKGKGRQASESRALAALLVLESGQSLTELGRLVNRDASSLSSAARRLAIKVKSDQKMKERFVGLASSLQINKLQS